MQICKSAKIPVFFHSFPSPSLLYIYFCMITSMTVSTTCFCFCFDDPEPLPHMSIVEKILKTIAIGCDILGPAQERWSHTKS